MKKALKIIGKVLLIFLSIVLMLLACIFIYNRIMLKGDRRMIAGQQISQMVDVDGRKMSIYVAGEGDHTLVFLAGSGATAPILDFKPFTERFSADYQIVITEKFGYGFSDEYDGSRDVETRVRQYRSALKAAGVQAPYILCPHSYSGLESIYWAQQYPEEVEAIIGLDMALPRAYDSFDDELVSSIKSSNTFKRTLNKLGIVRVLVGGFLPKDEPADVQALIKSLICRSYCNKTVSAESEYIFSDIKALDSMPIPNIPTLLIVSDGTVAEGWIDIQKDYASNLTDSTTVFLNCGHSVYNLEPEKCEKAMREFIEHLK
ncbi:MAG: alpha/beta hydrolase [Lachnospiraceae bacterium]|nr:alpha/beta hydrolase [Lachnospiraceae bacterium]